MQRATRSSFRQKGAEIQKIDQPGTWAIIDSYWMNPDWEPQKCKDDYKRKYGRNFVSIAKWIYSCKRVVRKSDHRAEYLTNGESLVPCYYVEPSQDKVFPVGRLVWLEPLPQLNGFLIVEEGGERNIKECPAQGYGGYYGDGYGGYGDGYGDGYGGYGSGYQGGDDLGGSCLECLSRLCIERNSYGAITGIYYVLDDGTKVPVGDCYSSSGGEGGGEVGGSQCCGFGEGALYIATFDITWNGDEYTGIFDTVAYSNFVLFFGVFDGPLCDGNVPLTLDTFRVLCENGYADIVLNLGCNFDPVCVLTEDDFDIVITGCPGHPTYNLTIKPGRCMQGYIVIRPA